METECITLADVGILFLIWIYFKKLRVGFANYFWQDQRIATSVFFFNNPQEACLVNHICSFFENINPVDIEAYNPLLIIFSMKFLKKLAILELYL